jgi:hypothetical protein
MSVVDGSFDLRLKLEERSAMPLAGGIMQHGYQCGMIWGATLAAGAQMYRLHGPGPLAEAGAIIAAQRIVNSFRACTGNINCFEITELDKSSSDMDRIIYFLIKGGTIGCFRMAAKYAPIASSEINSALSEGPVGAPAAPASCSAMLARKMGVSDLHAVMAAGLAGGIGLSGGGCGALGAAIWITVMNGLEERGGKVNFKDPRAREVIDRFLKSTGYEFECSKIVGRMFDGVADHAGYLRDGGCSEIIEVMASR